MWVSGARRWVQGDVGHHRPASSLQICERGGEECHVCGPRERAWVSFKAESEGFGNKEPGPLLETQLEPEPQQESE